MKTAIVTDTNSGMSAAEGRDRGIFILPMPVIIDAKTYKEGVDITNQEVFEAMQADRDISTSQPDLLSLENIWKEAFAAGYDEIVHIPMSSGLSGSCAMAQQMAMKYEGKVQVVDNHRISLTMYESVLDAKAMADAGKSAKEIRETLEEHGLEATIYLIVDTMKYLEKGGRITHGAAVMGSLFKIKPVLTIQGEKIDAVAKARGIVSAKKKFFEFLKKDYEEWFAQYPKEQIIIGCASTFTDQAQIDEISAEISNLFPDMTFAYQQLPSSVACHTGPGTFGGGIVRKLY